MTPTHALRFQHANAQGIDAKRRRKNERQTRKKDAQEAPGKAGETRRTKKNAGTGSGGQEKERGRDMMRQAPVTGKRPALPL